MSVNALLRTVAGLLSVDDFDRADEDPLASGDWDILAESPTGGGWRIESNRLACNTGTTNRAIECNAAVGGKMFLQCQMGWHADSLHPTIIARFAWGFGSYSGYMLTSRDNNGDVALFRVSGGTSFTLLDSVAQALNTHTFYDHQLYVADGIQEAHAAGNNLSASDTIHDGQNTRGAGLVTRNDTALISNHLYNDFLWMRSKSIVITGLEPGWKAKVRNTDASVVAEAVADGGGSAVIDASLFGGATEKVPIAGWTSIQITDGSDVEQFVYNDTTIFPGDEYEAFGDSYGEYNVYEPPPEPPVRVTASGLRVVSAGLGPNSITTAGLRIVGIKRLNRVSTSGLRIALIALADPGVTQAPAETSIQQEEPEVLATQALGTPSIVQDPVDVFATQVAIDTEIQQILPRALVTQDIIELILQPCPPLEAIPIIVSFEFIQSVLTTNLKIVGSDHGLYDVLVRYQLFVANNVTVAIRDSGWIEWNPAGHIFEGVSDFECYAIRYGFRDECSAQRWTFVQTRLENERPIIPEDFIISMLELHTQKRSERVGRIEQIPRLPPAE